ncbi:MAG: sigma-70 family RNA polymerase sigma factor [Acidobacteria bacterium]|nr:sigma-70 family RNA polymerase sigma factor [Acidobacteriota bacterium]
MEVHDERALVAAAQQGDRRAMETLLRAQHDRIHAVCRRITGNESDAADATQEALIAVVRGLPRFDGRSAFSTWVYRIATNASLDELRRRRRRPMSSIHHDDQPDHEPVETGPGPDDSALGDRQLLEAALRKLPEEFRVPVVLRDVADLDYAEIAETLGVPVGTVKSRIARGRGMLAEQLGNHFDRGRRPTGEP